ncbi:hypothetical protein KXX47_004323 [Aspergillus fumigatus]|nr:hypothetical protein KXX47_004323 [Aspergillus fumigatus]
MKITAVVALALAAVVAASPVAEPKLVERSCKSDCASLAASSCSKSCASSPSCYTACYNAKVTATSGKATLGGRISDWAFVEMNDVAIEKSFRPNHMFPVRGCQQPSRCKAGGEPLTNFDPLIEGDVYIQMARTTGITTGLRHGKLVMHCCKTALATAMLATRMTCQQLRLRNTSL